MKGSWNVVWGLSVWIGGTIADREREGEKGEFHYLRDWDK